MTHVIAAPCPAWCDRTHSDYSSRCTDPNGEVVHWRTLTAADDPSIEYARVTQTNTWRTSSGTYPFVTTSPGPLRLVLSPHWATADLNGPDGDELAETITRGRNLIRRLKDGGRR